eukprot:scaffold21654_cov63-Cyclotella_meneghiniana.AAC.2
MLNPSPSSIDIPITLRSSIPPVMYPILVPMSLLMSENISRVIENKNIFSVEFHDLLHCDIGQGSIYFTYYFKYT